MTTLQVNIHAAKSRLSELLREVEAGTDVIVARAGQPVAKLIPWPPKPPDMSRRPVIDRPPVDLPA